MGYLALNGGSPIRTQSWPGWPIHGEEEKRLLLEVLESGKWGRLDGKKTVRLEERFAEMHGVRFGIAATNGTHTLQIALQAAGIRPGDEVIVPAYTFLATATSCLAVGAIPVFADIDPDTYLLDPAAVEAAITERTRAIIPVHLGGYMCPMHKFQDLATRYNLKIIEDSAQGLISKYDGKFTGHWGDLASFSFQASKNASGGEGGMVLTNDPDLARLARSYHNCGRVEGGQFYEHHVIGSNYRMTEWQAAILLAQFERLEPLRQKRQANAELLAGLLAEIPGVRPVKQDPLITQIDYHTYIMTIDPEAWGVEKMSILKALYAEGVPVGGGYNPLHLQPMFREDPYVRGLWQQFRGTEPVYPNIALPNTMKATKTAAWFLHTLLLGTADDTADIAKAFAKVWEHRGELTAS